MSFSLRRAVSVLSIAALLAGGAFWMLSQTDSAQAADKVTAPRANDIVIGNPKAPVTVVEYASMSCPHCADFFTRVMPEFQKKYIDTGKVKLISRDYPLNEPALRASMLVHCAPADKQVAFIRVLFGSQDKWAFDNDFQKSLASIASLGGMPQDKFDACMKNTPLQTEIIKVRQEAETNLKIESTPTFFVEEQKLTGPHELSNLSAAIDPLLAKGPAKR